MGGSSRARQNFGGGETTTIYEKNLAGKRKPVQQLRGCC